jgi:tetratricopeptide (TPR) repeat protein
MVAEKALSLISEEMPWQSLSYAARIYGRAGKIGKLKEIAENSEFGENMYLSTGQYLLMEKEYDKARTILEMALSYYPDSFAALNNLAVLYYSDGDTGKVDSLIDVYRQKYIGQPEKIASLNELVAKLKNMPALP